jgi:hypothetical protein
MTSSLQRSTQGAHELPYPPDSMESNNNDPAN